MADPETMIAGRAAGATHADEPPVDMRRRLLIVAAGAVLLALALVVPALAIVVVWPMLFFVPGWLLLARLAPSIEMPGRIGLSVVVSVYLSAHVTHLVATAGGGFSVGAVIIATAILALIAAVMAVLPLRWLRDPRPLRLPDLRYVIQRHRQPFGIALLAMATVGGILYFSLWHLTSRGWVSGGWNWSDLLVHVSIAESIRNANFPPQVPFFAGAPLLYHWFADFHAAIAVTVAGIDVISVFIISNALLAGAFVLLVWELAAQLTHNRRVAALAAVLALFGGGMGFIRLPIDLATTGTDLWTLVSTTSYDNVWSAADPRFRIASVLGTGFLAHRATALGLPGLVAVVLLVHASLGRRPAGMLLAGFVAAFLAPFQFYAFPAAYLLVLLYVLARRAWRQATWLRDAALFLLPLVVALPFVIGPLSQQSAQGSMRLVAGWTEAPLEQGWLAVAFFYATNLGVPFILALGALFRRGLPWRGFLAAWALVMFVIPNVLVVGPEFDMNRYFQFMWLAIVIMAAWLIRDWPRPAVAAVLVLSMLSPALAGVWNISGQSVVMSVEREKAARWIASNTEPLAVFVTDSAVNSPVDLAGRLRLTTYLPYIAHLGYDPERRVADVQQVYCEGTARASAIMRDYGARYVISAGGLLPCPTPTDFSTSPDFETAYSGDGVMIWRLTR
jgi:hypothetical protein